MLVGKSLSGIAFGWWNLVDECTYITSTTEKHCCELSKEGLICFPLELEWQGCLTHRQADGAHCKKSAKI